MSEHKAVWTARKIKDDVNMSWRKEFIEREKGVLKEDIQKKLDNPNLELTYNMVYVAGYRMALREILGIELPKARPSLGLEEVEEYENS